jgi:hypothetical protein
MLSVTCLRVLLYFVPAGHPVGEQGEHEQQQQPIAGSSSGSQPLLPPGSGLVEAAVLECDLAYALWEQGLTPPAAAAAAGASDRSIHDSHFLQQQQEQDARGGVSTFQPQQLLLVGSKVTGDRNVPAGQVTFAVDLGSRSREGAGNLLQLPAGVHTAVEVNGRGTRPLVVKVRASMFLDACFCFATAEHHAVEARVFIPSVVWLWRSG